MNNAITFNLSALAEQLFRDNRKIDLAMRVKSAVDTHSLLLDLRIALEACDALAFSLANEMNQPPNFREASEAALMSYIVLLYVRATKTSSDERKQYDPRPKFTPEELVVHKELCDLRDLAVAHYGTGGSYIGNWVREVAISEFAPDAIRTAVLSRRQIIDAPLLHRARAQIARAMEILDPVVEERIDAITNAIEAECKRDATFYPEFVMRHPLNTEIFLGGADQVAGMQAGRLTRIARGSFSSNG